MWGWIAFAIFIEMYAVGMTVLAKKSQMEHYWLCLIPLVAFFYVDKILPNGFSAFTIKFQSLGKLVVKLLVVSLAAYIYMQWGINNLPEKEITPITQLMMVPIGICLIIFWVGLVSSTLTLMFGFGVEFKCERLMCILMFPIPVLMFLINKDGKNYKTEFRRKL